MIASAAVDTTVVLYDFKTGKNLYTGDTSGRSKFKLFDKLLKAIPPPS